MRATSGVIRKLYSSGEETLGIGLITHATDPSQGLPTPSIRYGERAGYLLIPATKGQCRCYCPGRDESPSTVSQRPSLHLLLAQCSQEGAIPYSEHGPQIPSLQWKQKQWAPGRCVCSLGCGFQLSREAQLRNVRSNCDHSFKLRDATDTHTTLRHRGDAAGCPDSPEQQLTARHHAGTKYADRETKGKSPTVGESPAK